MAIFGSIEQFAYVDKPTKAQYAQPGEDMGRMELHRPRGAAKWESLDELDPTTET
jgi:hypothetical protein